MNMMKSSMEETKIPGLYDWKQKIGLFAQFISFVVFLVCFILNVITRLDLVWVLLVLFVLFLSMAYNNYMVYHRKHFTSIYLLGAVISIALFGGMLLG